MPTDEPLVSLPANALDAIAFISATLGEGPNSCVYDTPYSAAEFGWSGGSSGLEGRLVVLQWKLDGRMIVQLVPSSTEQWTIRSTWTCTSRLSRPKLTAC